MKLISGTTDGITGIVDQWFTLPNIAWDFTSTTEGVTWWEVDIMIRRIGGATVSKRVTVGLFVEI